MVQSPHFVDVVTANAVSKNRTAKKTGELWKSQRMKLLRPRLLTNQLFVVFHYGLLLSLDGAIHTPAESNGMTEWRRFYC